MSESNMPNPDEVAKQANEMAGQASEMTSQATDMAGQAAAGASAAAAGAMTQQASAAAQSAAPASDTRKLLGALTYIFPVIGVIVLLSDNMKSDTMLRRNSVLSIALGVTLFIITGLISLTGIGACLAPFVWLVPTVYYAIKAYSGTEVNIPVLTDFCKNQKWI